MNIAIIPARGGSKRIPRKNIKEFCGKPIISYSIETAIESNIFDHIIVSTDNQQIKEVAQRYNASVPFIRPAELSNDFAVTSDVIVHAIEWVRMHLGEPDMVCCIYATAPFIQQEDLIKGYEKFKTKMWDYVFAATSFPFSIQRAIKRNDGGGINMFQPEFYETRSQDLDEAFHDAGQFCMGKPESWIYNKNVFCGQSEIVVLPRWRVQDIDNEEDWFNAELIMKNLKIRESDKNEIQ